VPVLVDILPVVPEVGADGIVVLGMDLVSPQVASASADGLSTVLVIFSEPMAPDVDMLTPVNWTLAPLFGGLLPAVSSVSLSVDGITATLTLASAMSPDSVYRVTAPHGAEDLAGNVIDPAGRIADFITGLYVEPESGNPWMLSATGEHVPIGLPPFEIVPWSASEPFVSLAHAVWISLFSDARAADDERPLDPAADPPARGGWWADTYSGEQFGSKLWLLQHATGDVATLAKQYAEEALEWMVRDGVAARVEALAERQALDRLALRVLIARSDGSTETVFFPDLWAEVT